jgi:YgiT-type zinc finger domain-containing protein
MENKTCAICEEGKLKKKIVSYKIYGVELGKFPAHVCSKCGEEWFDEETALKIEKLEKEKGLFGLSKETKISYSGNSLIIRIPKEIADFMKLEKETSVLIHPDGENKLSMEIV